MHANQREGPTQERTIGTVGGWIQRGTKRGRTPIEEAAAKPVELDELARLVECSKPVRVIEPGMCIEDVVDVVGLSAEQRAVFDLALDGVSFFFTGSAGTGKSHTMRAIVEQLTHMYPPDTVFVTASTGVAACNIGGTTLHGFAGIGLGKGTVDQLCKSACKNAPARLRWRNVKVLIIDEISMIPALLFDKLEAVARRLKGKPGVPFGGIQIILCGDFFQLPPVNEAATFTARTWNSVVKRCVELRGNFRQCHDFAYAEILNQLRFGIVTEEAEKMLNRCLIPFADRPESHLFKRPTILYPHRADVHSKNMEELAKLPGTEMTYNAVDFGSPQLVRSLKNCQAPKELKLKKGALVLLIRNLDFNRMLVNGSQGTVIAFSGAGRVPIVRFTNGVVEPIIRAVWDVKMGKDAGGRKQIPLILGYASSIHKSQGMTLDCAEMKLANVWECGQAYVALSRVSTAAGMHLINYAPHSIRASPEVVGFHKRMCQANLDAESVVDKSKKAKTQK